MSADDILTAEIRRPGGVNLRVLVAGLAVAVPLLAILVLNIGRDPHAVRSPLVGRAAPGFSLVPIGGGQPVALEQLRGHPVVLNFWATWCVPCLQEHPALSEASHSFPEVQFLGVVYEDDAARATSFVQERPSGYPSLLDPDGRTAIAYGVFGVPETFFIDGSGRIVEKFVGPLEPASIAALIARAKGAAP